MSRRPLRRGRGKKKNKVDLPPPISVEITTLESQGDGAAALPNGKRVYVPGTLPGDHVEVEFVSARGNDFSARAKSFLHAGPRREPDCPVFESCGGCQLQHLPDAAYRIWKTEVVKKAFARQGLNPAFRPIQTTPLASRRRTTFKVLNTTERVIVGYNSAQSHQVVDISHCPRLIDSLNGAIAPIRQLAARILPTKGSARFSLTDPGTRELDVLIEADIELNYETLEILSAFAHQHHISRITKKASDNVLEPVVELVPVTISFADWKVPLPPESFLQPSAEGQQILTDLVVDAVGDKGVVIDLFSGLGTFSIPLAAKSTHVLAVDGTSQQINALQAGVNSSAGVLNVRTETRDLNRNPLVPSELNHADVVVFDPPRAGAKEQAHEIAQSSVPRVVAVSCNPSTMARDLRTLVEGGYEILEITPVDQFPMSYHVEAVATLAR